MSSHQSLNDSDLKLELFDFVYHAPELPDSPELVPTDVKDESRLAAPMSNLQSSSPISDISEAYECTGILVHWTTSSVWDSYSYTYAT